jgi:hypothetical protein
MDFNMTTYRELIDLSKPVIVSMENFTDLKNAASISDDGIFWEIDLMYLDQSSRNNNLYPIYDTQKSFNESDFVQENLRNRTWYGEYEHPASDSPLSRFLFIEPTRYAWNILSLKFQGDKFRGKVGLCEPLGTSIILPNMKKFGSNYASSCRIYTPNFVEKVMNGKKICIKKYRQYPITFDAVTMPGYAHCRVADPFNYQPKPIGEESLSCIDIKFDNPVNELVKVMASENSKILEDYFHVDFKKHAILMKDNKVKFSSEDGVSLIVDLDRYILNEALKK